jgi:predicted DNA-binding antitoxin AbrB/MazE fold protein
MELDGVVQNGVIVPQGECSLPNGTKVRVVVSELAARTETVGDRLNRLAERFKDEGHDLPADYSVNFEHYIFGTPKRS